MHGQDEETGRRAKTFPDVLGFLQTLQNYLFKWRYRLPSWLLVVCGIMWYLVLVVVG